MTTIICDAIEHAGPPMVSKRPHAELLAKPFEPEACFYLQEGTPYVVYPDWDYAEYWGPGPVREVHPFGPVIGGREITEAEFRSRVREIHDL